MSRYLTHEPSRINFPSMAGLSAENALRIWQAKGLLSPEQVNDLRAALAENETGERSGRGVAIFSMLGAVLLGAGLMLFVGSNWDIAPPWVRIALVAASYTGVCAGAYIAGRRQYPRVCESLWFLATLFLGGGIFLLAQIFNFSLTYWQGPALWLVGTVAMAYARQRGYYVVLAVPLAILALGWFGGGSGWFRDDQTEFLTSDRGLLPLLGLLAMSCVSLGLLARRAQAWAFSANALIAFGSLMVATLLLVCTLDNGAVEGVFKLQFTMKQLSIIGGTLVLVTAAALLGGVNHQGRALLIGTTAVMLALIYPASGEVELASPHLGSLFDDNVIAFGLYVFFVFTLSLAAVWVGVATTNRFLINVGIVTCALTILIQYFSWSFDMLPTSFVFILGGVVLIGVSLAMERFRRRALARVARS